MLQPNFPPTSGTHSARPVSRWQSLLSPAVTLILHICLLTLAFALAFAVRYDFSLTSTNARPWLTTYFLPLLPLLLAIKLSISFSLGLHRGTWRYVGLGDLRRLLLGSLIALILLPTAYYLWQRITPHPSPLTGIPNTIFLLDSLFALLLLGGARVLTRLLHEESRPIANGGLVRLLIIGAGDAAESALREIARMPEQRYRVVGLLDDDLRKTKTRLHGSPILGPISSLPRVCTEKQVAEILIALPNASNQEMQRIISMCRATQMAADMRGSSTSSGSAASGGGAIRFRTLPSLQDIVAGKAFANQIRDVSVNDLLGRDAVQTDLTSVGALLHQQTVLVSGAGGSIGSELCRTICQFAPTSLILLDKAENAIFEIERELKKEFPTVPLIATIGDISDAIRMEQVFADYAPAVVFHAAAHKHVPLAESNPGEAIRNNVFGTKTLADAAVAAGVKNFVMISTDKAVNPSSIMGATKRCAEIYIQSLAHRQLRTQDSRLRTDFITVRFGNVLGSNGSVVPIFKQQIAAGGPVTVTHPEMRRYFMTIPEASQLVLQAGALGQRGEIFVLDMGQPVRILDLARDVIILSGLRPEVDIPIVFTGLRPGEKLYEELSIRGENMLQTRHPKIAIWRSQPANNAYVQKMIDELEPLQHCTDRQTVLFALKQFVPEMSPWQAETRDAKPANSPITKPIGDK